MSCWCTARSVRITRSENPGTPSGHGLSPDIIAVSTFAIAVPAASGQSGGVGTSPPPSTGGGGGEAERSGQEDEGEGQQFRHDLLEQSFRHFHASNFQLFREGRAEHTNEHEQMWAVGYRLRDYLSEYGFSVRMPVKGPADYTTRLATAVDWGADAYIALHSNAAGLGCGTKYPGGLLLVPVAGMRWIYLVAAIVLGAWFLWDTWRVYRRPEEAMRLFTTSTIYLSALFAAVMLDESWPVIAFASAASTSAKRLRA